MTSGIISRRLWPSVFLLLFSYSFTALADGTVTMLNSEEFKGQRKCAINCFNNIEWELSCDQKSPENDCYCRPDLQSVAVEYVSSCVNNGCNGADIDINKATNIYKNYCTSNGYTQLPATREASATKGASNATALVTVTATVTATVAATVTVTGSVSESTNSAALVQPKGSLLLGVFLGCHVVTSWSFLFLF
jgi:hypothetical protein